MIGIRYSTHDELFEPHYCPQCKSHWLFCSSCGYIQSFATLLGDGRALITCLDCLEPFWLDENVITEVCPICEQWNSFGEYKEWVEEI